MSTTRALINPQICTDIADAVRSKRVGDAHTAPMKVSDIAEEIDKIKLGYPWDLDYYITRGEWVRPSTWPNLDLVPKNNNTLYFTVDTSGRIENPYISIQVKTISGQWQLSYGVLDVETGNVSGGETVTLDSLATYRQNFSSVVGNLDVVVVKVTAAGGISDMGFPPYTDSSGRTYEGRWTPVVEATGHMSQKTTDGIYNTWWLERDSRTIGLCSPACLSSAWYQSYNLQSLDVSTWDTSNWALTTLANTWYACVRLQELDLSGWDTSNWVITTLAQTWDWCSSMHTLNISTWNTDRWAVTNFSSTWSYCYALQELDLRNWNTANWKVSNLGYTWLYCSSLKEIKGIENFDTSQWANTTLYETWMYCYNLKKLDLSKWDTSKWAVTNARYTWYTCYCLEYLDVSTWDTSKWIISGVYFGNTWSGCASLQFLDLKNWDVSKWTLTYFGGTWSACYCLEYLDVSTWDTSNWAVTDISGTWSNCQSLRELDVSTWDTSNWAVTTMQSTWNTCRSLRNLDLSNWNTSNWAVTNMNGTWYVCSSLQTLDVSTWNTSNWAVTAFAQTWDQCASLKILDLSSWNITNWNVTSVLYLFRYCYALEEIKWPSQGKFDQITVINPTFFDCRSLKKVDFTIFDVSKFKTFIYTTSYQQLVSSIQTYQYLDFGGATNVILPTTNIYLYAQIYPKESLLNLFNALATTSTARTIKLYSATVLNRLTAAEKAIATSKGYTLTA